MQPVPPEHVGGPSASLARMLDARLQRRAQANQLRARRPVRVLDSTHLDVAGRRCVNFAANNYLGLTHHPKLISLAGASPDAVGSGAGSGAAALISGYTETHAAAEASIAHWKSTESAVLLPSGYQANLAAIQTFAALANEGALAADDPYRYGVRFLVDKLVHASLIDAVRAVGLPFRVFPHNHLGKLGRLLGEADDRQLQVVVTESIFSMDGDAADIAGIAALKSRFPFALMIDEAHACGVYGDGGAGLLAELEYPNLADVVVCTFSKAAGTIGGAVCATKAFCDGLVNFGRAYIYSTSVPQWVAKMARTAIEIMHDEPWRQQRVRELATNVRARLKANGMDIPDGNSPIVPVIVGDEKATVDAAQRLSAEGIFVTAIRPPTVPRGTSRLRFTLSCDHIDQEIESLLGVLKTIVRPVAKSTRLDQAGRWP